MSALEIQSGRWQVFDGFDQPHALIQIVRGGPGVGSQAVPWAPGATDKQLIGCCLNLSAAGKAPHFAETGVMKFGKNRGERSRSLAGDWPLRLQSFDATPFYWCMSRDTRGLLYRTRDSAGHRVGEFHRVRALRPARTSRAQKTPDTFDGVGGLPVAQARSLEPRTVPRSP